LEKAGVLLPVFWVLRLGRYGIRLCYNRLREHVILRISNTFKSIFTSIPLISYFASKKYIEAEESEETEVAEETVQIDTGVKENTVEKTSEADEENETAEIPNN
jgi:hypothetical protein